MAEGIDGKARRLLTDGRLTVTRVLRTGAVVAECRGDSGTHALGYDPEKHEWRCTCVAYTTFNRKCSHVTALQLVTVRPRQPEEGMT